MTPMKLEWVVYHEPQIGTSSRDSTLELLTSLGYVADTSGRPGTYRTDFVEQDPRTGTSTYDLDVFEDPKRPVIARIQAGIPPKKLR